MSPDCVGILGLPIEIIVDISCLLEPSDIKALRLVNRQLAAHCLPVFRRCIGTVTLSLENKILETLIRDFQLDGIICHATKVNFVSGASVSSRQGLLDRLIAFFVFAQSQGRLDTVSISTVNSLDHTIILQAIQITSFPLQGLYLHPSGGINTPSVHCYSSIDDTDTLATSLQHTKEFSWSIASFPGLAEKDSAIADPGSQVVNPAGIIQRVFAMLPLVEKLDILWSQRRPYDYAHDLFFPMCYKLMSDMTRLQDCSLRGLFVTPASLEGFLKNTTARKITLKALRLRFGTYTEIFNTLRSGRFNHIHLVNLYEFHNDGFRMLFYNAIGRSRFGREKCFGPSEIVRVGIETVGLPTYRTELIERPEESRRNHFPRTFDHWERSDKLYGNA